MNLFTRVALAVLIVVIVGLVLWNRTSPLPWESPSPSPTSTNYNNRYMSVDVTAGWEIAEVGTTGAVNITNGNWVLFISPAAVSAAGVQGGRFDEYAGGKASVELVMNGVIRPRAGNECSTTTVRKDAAVIEGTFVPRHDFYTKKPAAPGCTLPRTGPNVWFLSIVGSHASYNDVTSVTDKSVVVAPNGFPKRQFAITMSYIPRDTPDQLGTVDSLPRLGSDALEAALREMDAIVSTLVFK